MLMFLIWRVLFSFLLVQTPFLVLLEIVVLQMFRDVSEEVEKLLLGALLVRGTVLVQGPWHCLREEVAC